MNIYLFVCRPALFHYAVEYNTSVTSWRCGRGRGCRRCNIQNYNVEISSEYFDEDKHTCLKFLEVVDISLSVRALLV